MRSKAPSQLVTFKNRLAIAFCALSNREKLMDFEGLIDFWTLVYKVHRCDPAHKGEGSTPSLALELISSLRTYSRVCSSGGMQAGLAIRPGHVHCKRCMIARPITQSLSLSLRKLNSSVKWLMRWR